MSEVDTVARRCKRCKIYFNIKPDEQAWWLERDLYLPSHCKDCRMERRREKDSGISKHQQRPEPIHQDLEISLEFDAEFFEMHQDAMGTLARTVTDLRSRPLECLVTFADLDRFLTSSEEVVASSQLLGIIPSKEDAEDEAEETVKEESAETIPEELLESSPQTTEAPQAQDELPSLDPVEKLLSKGAGAG